MVFDNIRQRCEAAGITIAGLEKATGIGNGVIRRWEEGRPRVDLLMRVSDYFGCSVDDLLRGGHDQDLDRRG